MDNLSLDPVRWDFGADSFKTNEIGCDFDLMEGDGFESFFPFDDRLELNGLDVFDHIDAAAAAAAPSARPDSTSGGKTKRRCVTPSLESVARSIESDRLDSASEGKAKRRCVTPSLESVARSIESVVSRCAASDAGREVAVPREHRLQLMLVDNHQYLLCPELISP